MGGNTLNDPCHIMQRGGPWSLVMMPLRTTHQSQQEESGGLVESSARGLKHPALQSGSTTVNGLSPFWSQLPHLGVEIKWE